ncbi:hypothetical protein Q8A64_09805 [Oxalobacteraceae bacterium R-40]|uniref:Uncharacterized protein n=1 Tax=Keguizhuia sedimenti TaxID=3064264 RepID=A0ABU1BNW4_9BURK|nr:hypothetical protein [Oxalobacteraceae bacterium R-40]
MFDDILRNTTHGVTPWRLRAGLIKIRTSIKPGNPTLWQGLTVRSSRNYHNDVNGQQWLTFVDPKGIKNVDLNHPKLRLYKEVKVLEGTLEKQIKSEDSKLILNAFILSSTKFSQLLNVGNSISKAELEERHVLFMEDGGQTYLQKMFSILSN